ncbi:MAG TPA: diaminopimelate epimerase [Flavobacteriaceae bacterium]|nr:diaminopimelate epimerase [Flavobacteriaceae bacterium]
MKFDFQKYQGTGNDFIIIDNRDLFFPKHNTRLIADLCHRKFGIGADGLMLLENHPTCDFKMVYFNSDGRESTMCGNGGRCLTHFAKACGIEGETFVFEAIDGVHSSQILASGLVRLKMNDVHQFVQKENGIFLDTGSPHHVVIVNDLETMDVKRNGAEIRYGLYREQGANINFVQQLSDTLFGVRTYERGVEDETLSCGTGVTAVALAMHYFGKTVSDNVEIKTPGGILHVEFEHANPGYQNIWLIGPAVKVFEGIWEAKEI